MSIIRSSTKAICARAYLQWNVVTGYSLNSYSGFRPTRLIADSNLQCTMAWLSLPLTFLYHVTQALHPSVGF